MTTQATTIGGTGTRPRPSLEELVDRLIAAMFRAEPETAPKTATPQRGPQRPRGAAAAAGGRPRRAAGGLRWRGHGKGGDQGGSVGLRRMAGTGEAALRRPGRAGLQPGNRQGSGAGSHGRRGAGGRGGPGDALGAGQGGLPAQPAGSAAPERRRVMVVANTTVDIPALKARHPLGDTVAASGSEAARSGQGPPGRLPLPR